MDASASCSPTPAYGDSLLWENPQSPLRQQKGISVKGLLFSVLNALSVSQNVGDGGGILSECFGRLIEGFGTSTAYSVSKAAVLSFGHPDSDRICRSAGSAPTPSVPAPTGRSVFS